MEVRPADGHCGQPASATQPSHRAATDGSPWHVLEKRFDPASDDRSRLGSEL